MAETVSFLTCPLCEATCGLEVRLRDGVVERIRGDADDVFSQGFLCPKGVSIKELHEDPDRLREPMRRQPDGTFAPVSWDEAFAEIDARLTPIIERGGRDAVAVYLGNPSAHNLSSMLYGRVFLKALATKNVYSASTVDQYPKQLASGLMFGSATTVPVPDLDRCEWLLVLGANPAASNGSLMTAPNARGRLQAIRDRGGRVVVVDPRRSRTAELADEWVPIRPGTDALLLFAMVHVLVSEGLVSLGRLEGMVEGVDKVSAIAQDFAPETVAGACGVNAETIRRLARELAAAERGCVYGRIGTTAQAFGTVASWLVDVLNALTGNLDREGGAMFPRPATAPAEPAVAGRRGVRTGRWTSRVRRLGEIFGELPVACLSEEIETPGVGQVQVLVTVAGNPVVSTPNSARLAGALESLDFMVSLDVYVNETTRFADIILPGPSPLERSHYDVALYGFAVRNVANYTPPLVETSIPSEWRTLLRLTGVVAGQGADPDVFALDDFVALEACRRETVREGSPAFGRDPAEVLAELEPRRGPERLLDLMLRCGAYDITLADLEANPHGIDLGALEPRLPAALRTPSGKVELAPEPLVEDVPRLRETVGSHANGALLLVGRRHLRSNNSWMHNLPMLARGPETCTVHVHPDDAARLGLVDGEPARVRSRVGEIELPVEVCEAIMPGVVSIPHGWGHDADGVELRVAREHAGACSNVLADEELLDGPSGTAVLNGIPVEVLPAGAGSIASFAGAKLAG